MTQINLTDVVFYKDGVPGQSEVAGFESGVTRVVRYTFIAPALGGTELTFRLPYLQKGGGLDIPIRFAISADPDSHCNANAATPYAGTVDLATAQGSVPLRLLPEATYYLWLFPGENMWGWYYAPTSGTATVTGVAQGVATVEGDAYIGQPVTVTIHSAPGYTHTLTWEFAGSTGTVGENLGETVTWTPPMELAHAIPNAPSGICTLTCCSYLDGVQVGQPQVSGFTLGVHPALGPLVSVTVTDESDAFGLFGAYLEKVSRLQVAVSTTLFFSATLTSTAITLDGEPYAGGALTLGDHTLAVTVTDSRGFTAAWQQTLTAVAYAPPQLEVHASRCRTDGTLDDTGDHAFVTLIASVTDLPGNTAALTLTYGKNTLEFPVTVGLILETAIIPADPNETLYIKGRVRDALKGTTRSMTLSTGYPTMEFLAGGKCIAFGMVPTAEGFQCAMDARFLGKVTDAQGRTWAARYDLTPVTGMYLTAHYGRVLEVLGAGCLQLKFKCNRNLSAGDTLYTCELPITGELTVQDTTGDHSLILTPTGVTTPNGLSTGTYTFSCPLY